MKTQITRQQLNDLLFNSSNGPLIVSILDEGGCVSCVRPCAGDKEFAVELVSHAGDKTVYVKVID